tara:strand:+ start:1118 stop:2515 length:1398 start_codon:yes stop_codon:yes gene_type:complete
MSNISAVRKFEIAPDNQTSGNSTWSYRNGNPIITFSIAPNEYYVRSKNLKLCFDVVLKDSAGALPNNNNQNGTGVNTSVVRLNSRVGVASLFSQLEINNAMNQNLETIRHYGRLLGSLLPSGSGWNEYTTYLSNEFAVSANEQVQGRYCNKKMSVAMPIMAGIFLQGADIPLSMDNGVGGLNLKFSLQSSIQALFGGSLTTPNSYYEISNVSLMGEYAMPQGGKLPSISTYPFSGFSSFYGVINNNDQTTQINPALSAVVSTFTNYVPTPHIANYGQDSMKTTPLLNKANSLPATAYDELAPITKISFMRGGVLYPLQFQIDENEVVRNNPAVANQFLGSAYDAQRQYYYSMAIRPRTSSATDQLAGQNSENFATANGGTSQNQHNAITSDTFNNTANYFQNVYGVGIRVGDMLGVGNTANFKQTSYSIRLISKLNGFSPMSSYTFFLYRSVINYDNNGLVSIVN